MKYRATILPLLVCALFQTGCSNQAAYTGESFSDDSPFKMKVDSDIDAACESVRRSLLGQGYLIDLASSEEVKARKAARGEGKQNAFIEMNVVCAPERSGSTIFATGVLSTYALKTNSSSASVGLSALGSISLPIGQSVDSLVKVSEETIDDKDFYKRFFTAVETVLSGMDDGEVEEESAVAPAQDNAAQETVQPINQPRIWPELFPEQDESEVAPESSPEQVESEVAPQSSSGQVEPEIAPAPFPVYVEPATTSGSLPEPLTPVVDPETRPTQEPVGITPAYTPDDEPLGIQPAPDPDDEPLGIPPAPLNAEKTPVADESGLAPISTTAVKRAVPTPAAAVQEMPEGGSQNIPASGIDNLF